MDKPNTQQSTLDIMLEMLNIIYMSRGDMPKTAYLDLSKRITDLYQEIRTNTGSQA